jgi:hypothetical protein
MKDHAKKPSRERRGLSEAQLDEAIEETFPASDPLSISPMTIGRANPPLSKEGAKSGKPAHGRR